MGAANINSILMQYMYYIRTINKETVSKLVQSMLQLRAYADILHK